MALPTMSVTFGIERGGQVINADITLKVADATPKVADATPKVADVTPKVADVTPKVADATPKVFANSSPGLGFGNPGENACH